MYAFGIVCWWLVACLHRRGKLYRVLDLSWQLQSWFLDVTLAEVAVGSTTFTNRRSLPHGQDGVCMRSVDILPSLAARCCSAAYVAAANVLRTFLVPVNQVRTEAAFVKLLWQLLSSYSVCACVRVQKVG